jgi:DNA-binding transcriptional LysR family regulator
LAVDLLQLEHFLAVAEEGNFTRAAERVCRTQPAVSQSIKKLEETVGSTLFARDGHEVVLTDAGQALLGFAQRMVRLRDDAVRQIADLRHLDTGHLSIAAHESAAVYLLPGPLRRYLEECPQIRVGIYRSRLEEIPRQVMDRERDIGFVKEVPGFHELQSVLVHRDEMVLIASPRHPLTRREKVTVRDLAAEPFVLHHLCAATEERVMRLFHAHGTRCRVVAELWSFENMKHFVRQEVGLSIVPRVTVAQELAAGALASVPVEGLDMPRETYMVFRDPDSLSPPARQFLEVVGRFDWVSWLPDEGVPEAPVPSGEAPARTRGVARVGRARPTRLVAARPSRSRRPVR